MMSRHTKFTQDEINQLVIPPDCLHIIEDHLHDLYRVEWKAKLKDVNDQFHASFFVVNDVITVAVNLRGGIRINRSLVYQGKTLIRQFNKLVNLGYPLPKNYYRTNLYPELDTIEFKLPKVHLPTLNLPYLFSS